jgi:uncharacterized membrane protein
MSDIPVQVIVAAFQDENGAEAALKELQAAKKARYIQIENAAVIRRDANNKVHIKDTRDMGGGKGAVIGGIVGGVIGVLFPPSILVSGAIGAAAGGLIAKFSDGGFPEGRLKEIGEALQPGTSAIVAVIDHVWVAEAEAELQAAGAKVFMDTVKADIAEQLAAGKDVSYSVVATDEGMSLDRAAGNKDEVQLDNLTLTDDAVTATSISANAEGAKVAAFAATAEGAVAISGTIPAAALEAPAAEAPALEAPAAETPAAEAPAPEAPAADTPAA